MKNLNKELVKLFHKHMERKNSAPSSSTTTHIPSTRPMPPCYRQGNLFDDGFKGSIFFYEWSNIYNVPKSFYSLEKFIEFLGESKIYLASWQREILRHMNCSYVSCRKGTKDLVIKNTWIDLKISMSDTPLTNTPPLSSGVGSESKEPYTVGITRPPSARHGMGEFEPEGRWQENGQGFHWYG